MSFQKTTNIFSRKNLPINFFITPSLVLLQGGFWISSTSKQGTLRVLKIREATLRGNLRTLFQLG